MSVNISYSVRSACGLAQKVILFTLLFASAGLIARDNCYSDSQRHKIIFENSSDGSVFCVDADFVHQGNELTIQFPLFNFEMLGSSGTLTSVNKLPHKYRPASDQTFICSSNDAYLQAFSNLGPYPTPLNAFELVVDTLGQLTLSYYGDPIDDGGHTFNSQTVSYPVSRSVFDPTSIIFTHVFNQQLLDYQFIPLPDTDFTLTVSVDLKGSLVTLDIPSIEFYISGITSPLNEDPFPIIIGGYVCTMSDFLSKELCPAQIQTVYDSYSGLNFSLNTYGMLTLSSPANVTAVIPTGTYTTAPVTLVYHLAHPKEAKIDNFIIQEGVTTFTGFTGNALNSGIRDGHANDLYKEMAAFSWSGNPDKPDQNDNSMDAYVAIGNVRHGKLDVREPIALTNNPANVTIFDSAVAINRISPNNIVVSFGLIDYTNVVATNNVSVSQDFGKTWSGPINIDPSLTEFGDARGVIADRYGNFWYSTSTLAFSPAGEPISNLLFYLSADGGYKWKIVFETTDSTPTNTSFYDYPQIVVGNDGDGNYGLWFITHYFDPNFDNIPRLGFIPTIGLGLVGTGTFIELPELINDIFAALISVSDNGKVFINSTAGELYFENNFYGNTLNVKFPGPLKPELVSDSKSILNTYQTVLPTASYPYYDFAYPPTTPNNTFYDEQNEALVILYSEQPDVYSQDFYLFLTASFDDGVTWSRKIQISDTHKNNRGYYSVAYDPRDGIAIGWYDSRNSPTSTGEQYFGAYVSRADLNCMLRDLKRNG